jgi:hypothetical protein
MSKGNADCHVYSQRGRDNHDRVVWSKSKCKHCVLMNKRILCKLTWVDCDLKNCKKEIYND